MTELKEKTLFLLDMDGTIYHENELIDGAMDFFRTLVRQGKDYAFMTNNSSKSARTYVEKLAALGIEATETNIVSSVNATILYLNERKAKGKLYVIGTDSFKQELSENGFEIVPINSREADVDFVVLGFDTELTYEKIVGGCYYVSRGYPYIATNCDLKCPIKGNRFIPDCGAIARLIEAATDRSPLFVGKPDRTIVDVASRRFNTPLARMVCIGDRLYTDIAVGINAGVDTVCVFTGEAKPDDIAVSPYKPTYTFETIRGLYEAIKD
ncbi:HAD-IIA family hydrolase [uncultured Bacteroides sp.]|uniref:HAD-IIA family hydrolase n=1 Tax=uncultured Bacteroides sp. TaxID=162156 RepID=UPI0026241A9A|nr:HAD-IIA family hydrolase [uncultured Bacteroides sp.]